MYVPYSFIFKWHDKSLLGSVSISRVRRVYSKNLSVLKIKKILSSEVDLDDILDAQHVAANCTQSILDY